MAEEIRWDKEEILLRLGKLQESSDKYHSISSVDYELPDGMTALEKIRSFQETLHKLVELYMETLTCDISQIEAIAQMMCELDTDIADELSQN